MDCIKKMMDLVGSEHIDRLSQIEELINEIEFEQARVILDQFIKELNINK